VHSKSQSKGTEAPHARESESEKENVRVESGSRIIESREATRSCASVLSQVSVLRATTDEESRAHRERHFEILLVSDKNCDDIPVEVLVVSIQNVVK